MPLWKSPGDVVVRGCWAGREESHSIPKSAKAAQHLLFPFLLLQVSRSLMNNQG